MNFSRLRPRFLILCLAIAPLLNSCQRSISKEERSIRNELRRDLRSRSFAAAVPLARRVLQVAPKDDGAWVRLAEAQAGLGDFSGLRQTLDAWQRAVPKSSGKSDEYRGDLARATGDPVAALAAWRKSVAHKNPPARVFAKIARLEEANRHWSDAAAAWSSVLELKRTATALLQRARCYRHLHHWNEALADLQSAALLAPNDPLVRQANERFTHLGKFLAEVRDLDKELGIAPRDAGLLADRALLFLRAQDPELALADATAAAKLVPDAVQPKLAAALAWRALGHAAEADRLGVEARTRLETLPADFLRTLRRLDAELAAEPTSVELHVNRAWQLNENGQPSWALADAEAALKLDQKSAGAFAEASYALAKLGRAPEAYERIKHATALDPNFSTAWQYRGELELKQGDYLAAIDSLSHALAINQTAAALAQREECYRKLGLLAKAADDHKALERFRAAGGPPP